MTKAEITKLAKKKYGPSASLTDSGVPSGEEFRAKAKAQRDEVIRQMEECKKVMVDNEKCIPPLIAAARFVVDVDGDDPSIPTLRAELQKAEAFYAARTQRAELQQESDKLTATIYHRRYTIYTVTDMGFSVSYQVASADTLEELEAMLANKPDYVPARERKARGK